MRNKSIVHRPLTTRKEDIGIVSFLDTSVAEVGTILIDIFQAVNEQMILEPAAASMTASQFIYRSINSLFNFYSIKRSEGIGTLCKLYPNM